MSRRMVLLRLAALVAAFFALYALTAQRGLGWGDSGEFQYRVLNCPDGITGGCAAFALAHPLYVALGKILCHTPFQVTLLSAFFGALSVGGLFLCTRRLSLAILFGLSHMLWWLSCLSEVQTMNLAFVAFGAFFLLRFLATGRGAWLVAACFLAGLQLNCHNFALLAAPALAYLLLRAGGKTLALGILAGGCGAAPWLCALVRRGLTDVLVGRYGGTVVGVLPANALVTSFNLALALLSLLVPAALALGLRTAHATTANRPRRLVLWLLFGVHALFFVRYFVPDQATFLLPTLFFAYLLLPEGDLGKRRFLLLALIQLSLPLLAWLVLAHLPQPEGRTPHPYRDDAAYFALPWKVNDTSAERCHAEIGGTWNGYPELRSSAPLRGASPIPFTSSCPANGPARRGRSCGRLRLSLPCP